MNVRDNAGRILDAQVSLEASGDVHELVIESRGPGRNTDYIPAFRLLLERMAAASAELLSAELATNEAQGELEVPKRRWPIWLKPAEDVGQLASALTKSAAAAGRAPGARGSGNPTKRLRVRFRLPVGVVASLADVIDRIVGPGATADAAAGRGTAKMTPRERQETLEADRRLADRPDLTETEKRVVIKQRLAQRLFRERLKSADCRCRITGIRDSKHLRASHIKPWAECSDAERQDPANGLLLAPHVDHLFDAGFLSFEDDGTVLVSPLLERAVLEAWGLQGVTKVAPFSVKQAGYLAYHRTVVFRKPRR